MNSLRIENPCPMKLQSNGEGGFDCKSCNTVVKDFRGMSDDDIRAHFSAGICGVFTEDQLPGQQPMRWNKKWVFAALSLLALVGFSVSPVQAQTTKKPNKKEEVRIPIHEVKKDKQGDFKCFEIEKQVVAEPKKRRRRRFLRRNVRGRVAIGCPSF